MTKKRKILSPVKEGQISSKAAKLAVQKVAADRNSQRIDDLNRALLALANSNSSWSMMVSDEDEQLISKMILQAESGA